MRTPNRKRPSISQELDSLSLSGSNSSGEEPEQHTAEEKVERLRAQLKRMKRDVQANTSSNKQAREKNSEVQERVERNERNSRQMNLVIQGYVMNAAYNNAELREEKFCLKLLLEQGLKLSAVQTKAVMDTISKIHWLYGGKTHKVKGSSFIVRFDRQESIDTIYSNLQNLRDYKVHLPDGTKKHVSVKRDQTKAQKDQEAYRQPCTLDLQETRHRH
ncbi:hypothetical protein AAVH_24804 [Aphelenchoides avenae]|nr:hypothetical protein AAVH_24804 [Aphelenchus avenae]